MFMHQGIGLNTFNEMPLRKAVHAVYECCYERAAGRRTGPRPALRRP